MNTYRPLQNSNYQELRHTDKAKGREEFLQSRIILETVCLGVCKHCQASKLHLGQGSKIQLVFWTRRILLYSEGCIDVITSFCIPSCQPSISFWHRCQPLCGGSCHSLKVGDKEHAIAYMSKAFMKHKMFYFVTRKKLLALLAGLKNFHFYRYTVISCISFTIICYAMVYVSD